MPFGDQPETLASLRRKKDPLRRPTQPDLFDLPAKSLPPQTEKRIWSVRALVMDIRTHTESAYSDIWVEGEISNCRPAASGHIYFTLKDGEAQLPIVLFRRQAQLLRFRPQDGLAVLVRGRISVYESRGQLQLIAETLEPRGAGALQLAFEQLKRRLADEGLFDSDRKRPLPAFPHCVGIVTSSTGAVIRDIVTVVRRRHARLNILVFPATMQGSACCGSVAAGIRYFNQHPGLVDVIVLARGGGSIEDLSGFNDEALARAIAESLLPVVSAIGHETDFTIADFVADLRAPTPSAAAEIITAAQHRVEDRVMALSSRITRGIQFKMMQFGQRYARLSADRVLGRLQDSLGRRNQRLDDLRYRLEAAPVRRLRGPAEALVILDARLQRQAPGARVVLAQRRLERAHQSLERTSSTLIASRATRLHNISTRLEALSPLAILNRGYSLIYAIHDPLSVPPLNSETPNPKQRDEVLLRSASGIRPGQQVRARLANGTINATVTSTQMEIPET